MSRANECDICQTLFVPEGGNVSIETLMVATADEPEVSSTWSDLDFCPACSKKLLALIEPALQDLQMTLTPQAAGAEPG